MKWFIYEVLTHDCTYLFSAILLNNIKITNRLKVCDSLSYDDGHTPLPILMKFGINVFGKQTERSICKDLFVSLQFQNGSHFLDIFHSYGRQTETTVQKTTYVWWGLNLTKVKLVYVSFKRFDITPEAF